MTDASRLADDVIDALRHALGEGEHGLHAFPALLKRVLKERLWRERTVAKTRRTVMFDRFEKFVVTPPLEGLGASVSVIRNLVRDDIEATALLDAELQRPTGNPTFGDAAIVDNVHDSERPAGNTRQAALRRLRKDRPDLLERVVTGELSAHAAAVEAGFRKQRTPLDLLRSAWRRASVDEREAFREEIAVD